MTRTTETVFIGATNVSANVKHIEVWQEINSVGRFRFTLRNTGGQYTGDFATNNAVSIDLGGATIIEGYIDSIHPMVGSEPDVFTQDLQIEGRDYGRELVDLLISKSYVYQKADDLIDQMLVDTSAAITYTSPSTASSLSYDSRYGYLLDNFRNICDRVGYDFYVDANGALQLFAAGSLASGITLDTSSNYNILSLERDEAEGMDIKNYIVTLGKEVRDGWTEFNAADFTVPTNGTASDETTIVKAGVGSIKYVKGAATESYLELNFAGTLYGRTSLDFSKVGTSTIGFSIYLPASSGCTAIGVSLTDTNGSVIYTQLGTDFINSLLNNAHWETCSVQVGKNIVPTALYTIGTEGPVYNFLNGLWAYTTGSTFNWTINDIKIYAVGASTFYLDNLTFPDNILMFGSAQDAASQASYGLRQIAIDKSSIDNQKELDAEATRYLTLHKDPMTTLTVVAKGIAGISGVVDNWKPGYTVTVNVPGESISSVSYRMVEIHHVWDHETVANGFDFTTTLSLVLTSQSLALRRWEAQHSDVAIQRELRDMVSILQKQRSGLTDAYPSLPDAFQRRGLTSTPQYDYYWEAEENPVSLLNSTAIVADTDASKGSAVYRTSLQASANMLSLDTIIPGTNQFVVYYRLKVTSNASTSTIATLNIHDVEAGSDVSLAIEPADFSTSGEYELFAIRLKLIGGKEYTFNINSFVTGITNLYCDWIGITDSPVAYATADIVIGSGATGLVNQSGLTNLTNVSGFASITVQSSTTGLVIQSGTASVHAHTMTNENGYIAADIGLITGLDNTTLNTRYVLNSGGFDVLYASLNSGDLPSVAFLAIKSTTSLLAAKVIPVTTNVTTKWGMTSGLYHNYDYGAQTNTGGGHTHPYASDTHMHPNQDPSHPHATNDPRHTHSHINDSHSHTESEGDGHKH